MGREIRRVPLDFDWPRKTVWKGFLNPHFKPCPAAESGACISGETPAAKWLHAIARLISMVGDQAIEGTPERRARNGHLIYPHPYLEHWPQAPRREIPHDEMTRIQAIKGDVARQLAFKYAAQKHCQLLPLTPEIAEVVRAFAGEADSIFRHFEPDNIDRRLRRVAKLGKKWGLCAVCGGEGIDPAVQDAYERWEKEPPPKGDGWQLWETVTEGSPVSPVLPTREAFVAWLVDSGQSPAAAEAFTKSGWCPSGVMVMSGPDAGLYEDIESAVLQDAP